MKLIPPRIYLFRTLSVVMILNTLMIRNVTKRILPSSFECACVMLIVVPIVVNNGHSLVGY